MDQQVCRPLGVLRVEVPFKVQITVKLVLRLPCEFMQTRRRISKETVEFGLAPVEVLIVRRVVGHSTILARLVKARPLRTVEHGQH
jgi:hypothetical protein